MFQSGLPDEFSRLPNVLGLTVDCTKYVFQRPPRHCRWCPSIPYGPTSHEAHLLYRGGNTVEPSGSKTDEGLFVCLKKVSVSERLARSADHYLKSGPVFLLLHDVPTVRIF